MPKNKDWEDLCDYIKKEILQYDDSMKIPRYLIYRLRGLAKGQFIANKNIKPNADYSFKDILYTFKICKPQILNCKVQYKDEQHKINTIMIFVEKEINDVVLRLKNIKLGEEKVEQLSLENQFNKGAEYKKKDTKLNKSLEDLW